MGDSLRGAFSLAVDQVGLAGLLTVMGPRTSRRRSQTAKLAHCGAPTRGRKNARKHRETGMAEAEGASIKYVHTTRRRGSPKADIASIKKVAYICTG